LVVCVSTQRGSAGLKAGKNFVALARVEGIVAGVVAKIQDHSTDSGVWEPLRTDRREEMGGVQNLVAVAEADIR
jgi:hypothetical protein